MYGKYMVFLWLLLVNELFIIKLVGGRYILILGLIVFFCVFLLEFRKYIECMNIYYMFNNNVI